MYAHSVLFSYKRKILTHFARKKEGIHAKGHTVTSNHEHY